MAKLTPEERNRRKKLERDLRSVDAKWNITTKKKKSESVIAEINFCGQIMRFEGKSIEGVVSETYEAIYGIAKETIEANIGTYGLALKCIGENVVRVIGGDKEIYEGDPITVLSVLKQNYSLVTQNAQGDD